MIPLNIQDNHIYSHSFVIFTDLELSILEGFSSLCLHPRITEVFITISSSESLSSRLNSNGCLCKEGANEIATVQATPGVPYFVS